MSDDQPPKTPNEELAGLVIEALIAEGLIAPERRDEVEQKLISGRAKQDDWRLWIEHHHREQFGGSKN